MLSDRVSVTERGGRQRTTSSTSWRGRPRSAPTPSCAARRAGSSGRWRRPQGIRPASIHDLYMAMGRGEAGGFTVPAINVRAMAYDTARAVIRSAKKLNAGAFIFEIARSEIGYTEQRPHEYAAIVLAAALREGLRRPDLHPGRSRPDQRQEVQQPGSRQGARHAARADQGRDRGRVLQHRHRHLDARRSRQADARRAAGGQRHAGGRLRGVHPRHRAAGRDGVGRRRDRRGRRQELRRARAARLHEGLQPEAEGARRGPRRPQQDQRADRHRARRLRQRRRHGADGREDRSEDARGAVARRARRTTASAAPSSTARRRCRPTRSTRSRGSAPARSTSPPTSRTWCTSTRSSRPT